MTKQIIHVFIFIFLSLLLYSEVGFCEHRNQSILKSVRTVEHKKFTRIVFEFKNSIQFRNPEIEDNGKFSVLFFNSSTDMQPFTVYDTDSLHKVQSVEFIKNKSGLTAKITLTFPDFMIKSFYLSEPDCVIVDAYRLLNSKKESISDTSLANIHRVDQKIDAKSEELMRRQNLVDTKLQEMSLKLSDLDKKTFKAEWAQRIKFSGDLRLRYQKDFMDDANEPRLGDEGLEDTNIDRTRTRYRARLGLKTTLVDPEELNIGKIEAGLRVTTGSDDNPVSTNETMGDDFNKDTVVLDRAYLKWDYIPTLPIFENKSPQITVTAGRMANPFFCSDLVWDKDLGFEGLTLHLLSDTVESNSWRFFLTVGAYALKELEFQTKDKWLYGGQIGIEHRPFEGLNYKLAVAYYDFDNVQGEPIERLKDLYKKDWDWSGAGFIQGGNTLFDANELLGPITGTDPVPALASDYDEININAMIDIDLFSPVHIILEGEYVKNLAYDKDKVLRLNPDVPDYALDQTDGYRVGIMLGYPETLALGDWNVALSYKRLEADAVMDAFTDSDFHMGGTDCEGWILSGQLGLYKNLWLKARWLSANEIIEENGQLAIDTLQVDLNVAF